MTPEQIRIMVDISLPMALDDEQREKVKRYMVDIVNQAVAEEREKLKDGPLIESGVNVQIKNGEIVSEEPRFISMRQALEEMSEAADVEANEADKTRKALNQAVLDATSVERLECANAAHNALINLNRAHAEIVYTAIRERTK